MSYTPTVWESGQSITGNGLNNIEKGIKDVHRTADAMDNVLSKLTNYSAPEYISAEFQRGNRVNSSNLLPLKSKIDNVDWAITTVNMFQLDETATFIIEPYFRAKIHYFTLNSETGEYEYITDDDNGTPAFKQDSIIIKSDYWCHLTIAPVETTPMPIISTEELSTKVHTAAQFSLDQVRKNISAPSTTELNEITNDLLSNLSSFNSAAEQKNEILNLNLIGRALGEEENHILFPSIFIRGSRVVNNRSETTISRIDEDTKYRITTQIPIKFKEECTYIINDGFQARLHWVDKAGKYIDRSSTWQTDKIKIEKDKIDYFYYLTIAYSNETTDIQSAEADISYMMQQVYIPVDSLAPGEANLTTGDLDTIEANRIYGIAGNSTVENRPVNKGGNFFGLSQRSTSNDPQAAGKPQFYVDSTGALHTRIYWGGAFTSWRTPLYDYNPLAKLNVLALGDSICKGGRNDNRGFIGDVGCNYVNIGVGGSTLSTLRAASEDSAHPIGAENIPQQLIRYAQQTREDWYIEPDAIIAEGGINDYWRGDQAPLGDVPGKPIVTDEEEEALALDTVAGGLQKLFYNMIRLYPRAKRFFLITHKTRDFAWTENKRGYTQTELHDLIVKVCALYGVKVIDVFNESHLNGYSPEYVSPTAYREDHSVTERYYVDSDGFHPLALGYREAYAPLVRQALMEVL